MSGYTNSQTWEAWLDMYDVSWNNTSFIFLASVMISVAIVVVSWMMPMWTRDKQQVSGAKPKTQPQDKNQDADTLLQDKETNPAAPGEVKKAQLRALEESIETHMTAEQRAAEREAQSEQLAAIFKMMKEQEEKFGKTTIDEIKDQMRLYCS